MLAFMLTVDQLEQFYEICERVGAVTEQEKVLVAMKLAEVGQINGVVKTNMSREEYIDHIAKQFGNVLVVQPQENKENGESTNIGFDTRIIHPGSDTKQGN